MNIFDILKNTFSDIPSPEFCAKLPENLYPFYLKKFYKNKTQNDLDLKNPTSYSEKIQWLKLYDTTPLKTKYSDKIAVREFIAETIGPEYLKPIFNVYNSFEEINFEEIPEYFVLKTNHSCNTNRARKKSLISDLGIQQLKEFYAKKMKENYAFVNGFELQYKDIIPKLFIEKYIPKLIQYSVLCFNGQVEYINVGVPQREIIASTWYDKNLQKQPFDIYYMTSRDIIAPIDPKLAEEIIACSEKLCKNFRLVRCDFAYSQKNNKIYFEEMTFTPLSGIAPFTPYEYENILGSKILLN